MARQTTCGMCGASYGCRCLQRGLQQARLRQAEVDAEKEGRAFTRIQFMQVDQPPGVWTRNNQYRWIVWPGSCVNH